MTLNSKYLRNKSPFKTNRRKRPNPGGTHHPSVNKLMGLGLILIGIGLLGLILSYADLGRRDLAESLPANTAYYVQINPRKIPLEQRIWVSNLSHTNPFLAKTNNVSFEPWIGSQAVLAMTDDNRFIARFSYHNKAAAQLFLEQAFLVPNEQWQLTTWADPDNEWKVTWNGRNIFSIPRPQYKLYAPQFSDTVSYSFDRGSLWIASDQTLLKQTLAKKEHALAQTSRYQSARPHLNKNQAIRVFVQSQALAHLHQSQNQQTILSPIITGIVEATPAVVITANTQANRFQWQMRFLSQSDSPATLATLNTPELANFSPSQAVFFFTGQNLRQHYEQTELFLQQMHPQFAEIFAGIWQSQAQKTFGPLFDFKADFLSHLGGQFALIIDTTLPEQAPDFTIITEFGRSDTAAKITQFQETLRFAQEKSTARVITVNLSEGREQNQVVSLDTSELRITEYPLANGNLYEVKNPNLNSTIYFGFRDQYLVLSTKSTTIQTIFEGTYQPLTQNESFRNTVLFEHKPSAAYGYIDIDSMRQALTYSLIAKDLETSKTDTQSEINPRTQNFSWLDLLNTPFASVVFSQKQDKNDTWWEIDLIQESPTTSQE